MQIIKSPLVTRLVLKRFRSVPTTTLVFDNPLFVVGHNGSGKSNLADGDRWWFDRTDKWKRNAEGLIPALEPSALALPLVGGDERFAPIFKVLGSMRVYSIEPPRLCEMQDPDSGVALKPDGSNAASVLRALLGGGGAAANKADINRILESIVTGLCGSANPPR